MKCPFRKYEAVVDARKEVIFGNCYMENCMAYRLLMWLKTSLYATVL